MFERIDTYIFIAVFLAILVGFLMQFGLLSWKGARLILGGVLAFVGWKFFTDHRANEKDKAFGEREASLIEQEKKAEETSIALEEVREEADRIKKEIETVTNEVRENQAKREEKAKEQLLEAKTRAEEASDLETLQALREIANS